MRQELLNQLLLWLMFMNVLQLLLKQMLLLFYRISIFYYVTFYSDKDMTNYGKISLLTTASAKSSE